MSVKSGHTNLSADRATSVVSVSRNRALAFENSKNSSQKKVQKGITKGELIVTSETSFMYILRCPCCYVLRPSRSISNKIYVFL